MIVPIESQTPENASMLSKEQLQRNVTELIALKEKAGTQHEKDLLMERVIEYQMKIAKINAESVQPTVQG